MKYSREALCLSYGLKLLEENVADKKVAFRLKLSLIQKTISLYENDIGRRVRLYNFLRHQEDLSCLFFYNGKLSENDLYSLVSLYTEESVEKKREELASFIRFLVDETNSYYGLSVVLDKWHLWDDDLAAFCLLSYTNLSGTFLGNVRCYGNKRLQALFSDYVYAMGSDLPNVIIEKIQFIADEENEDGEEDDEEEEDELFKSPPYDDYSEDSSP